MDNIMLTGVGIAYPKDNIVDQNELTTFYNEKNIRINSLMKILGKEKRFSICKDDKYYDLLLQAAREALNASQTASTELNMIVVATDTPEYLSPSNALRIAKYLKANNVEIVYDMNANCASSVVAIDQVKSYMQSNSRIKTALVLTVFMGSYIYLPDNPISFATFSDGVSAVILSNNNSFENYGIIDISYITDFNYANMDIVPSKGFKNVMLENNRSDYDLKIGMSDSVDLSFIPNVWNEQVNKMLYSNNLKTSDISYYLFSQFSLYHIKSLAKTLNDEMNKFIYVGDKYGYNGGCSPIYALYDLIQLKNLKVDDYLIICGMGAGYTSAAMLYKVGKKDLNYEK